jgi:hypothetical protein
MKKLIILAAFVIFASCKEETISKVKDASKAVATDVKTNAKKVESKVVKVIDTAKVKKSAKKALKYTAEKVEKGAKKIKEKAEK